MVINYHLAVNTRAHLARSTAVSMLFAIFIARVYSIICKKTLQRRAYQYLLHHKLEEHQRTPNMS